jgi:hypothetical protein
MSENLGYFMMNANSQMNENAINSMISKIITRTSSESNLYAHSCANIMCVYIHIYKVFKAINLMF